MSTYGPEVVVDLPSGSSYARAVTGALGIDPDTVLTFHEEQPDEDDFAVIRHAISNATEGMVNAHTVDVEKIHHSSARLELTLTKAPGPLEELTRPQTMTDGGEEIVAVHNQKYAEDAELEMEETDNGPVVTNHDSLERIDTVYGLTRQSVERNGLEHEILEPGDTLWRDEYADIEAGDEFVIGDGGDAA